MEEVAEEEIQTEIMDHHGLVAAVCFDIVHTRPSSEENREVTPSTDTLFLVGKRLHQACTVSNVWGGYRHFCRNFFDLREVE